MCSFLILPLKLYDKYKSKVESLNKKLKLRGPDNTVVKIIDNYVFIHNLLHFSGEKTLQPIIKPNETGNIILCYNGEIYNYKEFGTYKSDTEMIIEEINKIIINGISFADSIDDFVKKLDGEFTFIVFDFSKNLIIQASDIFSTKPQWYKIHEDGMIISSLRSTIYELCNQDCEFNNRNLENPDSNYDCYNDKSIKKLIPNQIIVRQIDNLNNENYFEGYQFDLHQYKNNFDDFNLSLEKAILKRVNNNNNNNEIGLCLSSGYDSGVINCCLLKNKVKHTTYSMKCIENMNILNKRIKISSENSNLSYFYDWKKKEYLENKLNYQKIIEGTSVPLYSKPNKIIRYYNLIGDWAGTGLFYIQNESKKDNIKIFLSGQGADEIYSDYGWRGRSIKDMTKTNNDNTPSSFLGDFPENLSDIFPWPNFFYGQNESFIAKEELVASLFGIETRYPFLDKELVQEFLWLSNNLKNEKYKAPLFNYMKKNNYPFCENEKVGFKAKRTSN